MWSWRGPQWATDEKSSALTSCHIERSCRKQQRNARKFWKRSEIRRGGPGIRTACVCWCRPENNSILLCHLQQIRGLHTRGWACLGVTLTKRKHSEMRSCLQSLIPLTRKGLRYVTYYCIFLINTNIYCVFRTQHSLAKHQITNLSNFVYDNPRLSHSLYPNG